MKPEDARYWQDNSNKLDQRPAFNRMRGSPYYKDAVYDQFSTAEYQRRFAALRKKMAEQNLDVLICPGGPSHWSWGGGMLWLSGHWEWHSVAAYVVFPKEGEPTLVYGMGGTHIEAVRQECAAALSDVRSARNGRFGEVMAERIKELGYEKGRIGLAELDCRHYDYMPVNQYQMLKEALPGAELIFTRRIIHEMVAIHSPEELDCVRVAGKLCDDAMQAIADRAKPGVTEHQLRGAAGAAIFEGGGDVDFLIIGTTEMANPKMVFGNPRPSQRKLKDGDIIMMELAVAYRGYSAQIGQPICLGEPTPMVRKFWDEVAKPGYEKMIDVIKPGNSMEDVRKAGEFFRENGYQSRPTHAHGIDFTSESPHIFQDGIHMDPIDEVMKPGMVLMAEPNPISADGTFGMFVGHTFIITETGKECVDNWPIELTVVKA